MNAADGKWADVVDDMMNITKIKVPVTTIDDKTGQDSNNTC
jgi:hypothetical protein